VGVWYMCEKKKIDKINEYRLDGGMCFFFFSWGGGGGAAGVGVFFAQLLRHPVVHQIQNQIIRKRMGETEKGKGKINK
jgi:hypothetical protein